MARNIKIHISTEAHLAAIRETNNELAKMAADVGRKNGQLRQATMLAARAYFDLGDAAEKASNRSVLSAKQIEEAWRKAMSKPSEEAARGFGKLREVAKGTADGIGGDFAQVAGMFLSGGIWGAAAAAAVKAFTWVWDKIKVESERAAKRIERAWKSSLDSIKDGAATVDKAFEQTNTAIDRAISKFSTMTNSVKELTKAEIELAKQHAIANGMDPVSANAAAADLSSQVDYEAEQARLQKIIELEQKRVEAGKEAEAKTAELVAKATAEKIAAEKEYQKKRDEYIAKNARAEGSKYATGMIGGAVLMHTVTAEEAKQSRENAALDFEGSEEGTKAAERIKQLRDVLAGIKTDEKAIASAEDAAVKIAEAQKQLETLEVKRETRELAIQNERADKANEEAKARDAADMAAAERKANAELAAAEKVANERARLDAQEAARRERERQKEYADKIREHQNLLAAERAEEAKGRQAIAAADAKLQQAWGWYRNKDSMAAQMKEEKADAEARKQFEKDFEKLKSRRWDWRKAENLSVDDEAVRRVALAREEKRAAEQWMRETAENTRDLAEKLNELLTMKGGE